MTPGLVHGEGRMERDRWLGAPSETGSGHTSMPPGHLPEEMKKY